MIRQVAIAGSLLVVIATGCNELPVHVVADPTMQVEARPTPPLENIDISKVPSLDKSRFQLGESATGEPNHVAKQLVANGKDAIPFLISKLDDETEMERGKVSFWYRLYVGDMALIILTDLFEDESGVNSTIPGFGWDDFLERGKDRSLTGEEVLRRYIRKHGRKTIKARWQKMWEQSKEKIFWDEKCFCFRVKE